MKVNVKKVNVNTLDWFHTMVWHEALGLLEHRDGIMYPEVEIALNRRFMSLRGYLPWHRPELMPDLGKLNTVCFDLAWEYYEKIKRGEIIFVY